MIKEAIDRILGLAVPNDFEFNGHTYVDKDLRRLTPPEAEAVEITTLQGLVDLYVADMDKITTLGSGVLVHVTSPTTVEIISKETDSYGRRHCWVKAQYPPKIELFPFGQWLNTEHFIIACQSRIQRVKLQNEDGTMAQDLDYVLRIASAISAEAIQTSDDDGISQKVALRSGIVLKDQSNLRPRVLLAPYRTFAEIDQVLSTFVFRARQKDGEIHLALFEADGGRWKLDAVAAIAAWLDGKFGQTPIIT